MSSNFHNTASLPTPVPEFVESITSTPAAAADVHEESSGAGGRREVLLGAAAVSYYISLVVHVVVYMVAAAIFFYFGNHLFDQTNVVVAVRARLDDHDVLDENPFEQIPEVTLTAPELPSKMGQMSNSLQAVDKGLVETSTTDLPSFAGTEETENLDPASSFLFRLPKSGLAVTKGSFTAWTSPENPAPGEAYRIIIEVRIPKDIKRYRLSDLSGSVKGTDDFERRLPHDRRRGFKSTSFYTDEENKLRAITGSEVVKVRDNRIQLVVIIPGGANLVRDTIKIKSRRLREEQELELVFGSE